MLPDDFKNRKSSTLALERKCTGTIAGQTLVEFRIDRSQTELSVEVKAAGGRWNPKRKVWRLPYGNVVTLGCDFVMMLTRLS
jgi:hypothetical protein